MDRAEKEKGAVYDNKSVIHVIEGGFEVAENL